MSCYFYPIDYFCIVKNQQPNIVTKMYAILRQLKRSYLLVALLLMGCLPVLAQTRTIQGKVIDAQNGAPSSAPR